ncbi:hypothetical protein [Polaromonas jejuensis]|nr:hypothetical protein [Polaromonas jejuensis]
MAPRLPCFRTKTSTLSAYTVDVTVGERQLLLAGAAFFEIIAALPTNKL